MPSAQKELAAAVRDGQEGVVQYSRQPTRSGWMIPSQPLAGHTLAGSEEVNDACRYCRCAGVQRSQTRAVVLVRRIHLLACTALGGGWASCARCGCFATPPI